jgi:hypothetical protein
MKKLVMLSALTIVRGLATSASATAVTNGGTLATNSNFGTITLNANGTVSFTQATGTYDGVDDVVYNVINNDASEIIDTLGVTGPDICDFDGDGIDEYANPNGTGMGFYGDGGAHDSGVDPNDYAGYSDGPNGTFVSNFFTNIQTPAVGNDSAVINFGGGGILVGHSAFFSLEAETGLPAIGITLNAPSAPLPPAVWGGLALILGIAAHSKFRKTKIA